MTLPVKEYYHNHTTGEVTIEYSDDSTRSYNMNDVVTAETNPVTGGMGFNGQIVDMDETPDETNTGDYPVGTLFISPAE